MSAGPRCGADGALRRRRGGEPTAAGARLSRHRRRGTPPRDCEAEHDVIGFYISGHPLDRYSTTSSSLRVTPTPGLDVRMDGQSVRSRASSTRSGSRTAARATATRPSTSRTATASSKSSRGPKPTSAARPPSSRASRCWSPARVEFGEDVGRPTSLPPRRRRDDDGSRVRAEPAADRRRDRHDRATRGAAKPVSSISSSRSGEVDESRLAELRTALKRHPGRCRPVSQDRS